MFLTRFLQILYKYFNQYNNLATAILQCNVTPFEYLEQSSHLIYHIGNVIIIR